MPSADFTVNGSACPPEAAVSASSTVTLALTDTAFRTVDWSIVSRSPISLAIPTITPGGTPLGSTATFNVPGGTGQSYLVQCVINGGRDDEGVSQSHLTKRAVVGTLNTTGIVPLAPGETQERDATQGWTDDLNAALDVGGTGSIVDDSVTFAKLQNIGVGLIGNDSGTADPKLITLGAGTAFAGGALVVDEVTLAMLADIATARFLGRVTASTGAVESLTGAQATTLLDVFTSGLKGLAPASGGGTTNFLRADGTWAPPSGASSASGGLRYAFDSSTTTGNDPGTGDFRLNNATLASVTAIGVSDTDSDAANNEAYLLTWDDSTTTANRGTITIRKESAPSTFAVYAISGASTDSSGWVQFVVTYVAGNGTFTNTDACTLQFSRTGDAGATGATGAAGADGTDGGSNFATIVTETTTARTFILTDGDAAYIRTTNAAATTVTVPPNASVAFAIGTTLTVRQAGAGQVTVAPGAGVTLNTPQTLKVSRQHGTIRITKVATNEWDVSGDLYCIVGVELTDANQTLAVAGGDDYAQVVALSANRSKGLSLTGATDGKVVSIRNYTVQGFTLTINDSTGSQLYQFAVGATGIVSLRYSGELAEWQLGSHKDLI